MRLLKMIIMLIIIISVLARIYLINISANNEILNISSTDVWVTLNGSFVESASYEKTNGLELALRDAYVISFDLFKSKYNSDHLTDTNEVSSVLILQIELRNTGFEMVQSDLMLLTIKNAFTSIIPDYELLQLTTYPLLEGSTSFALSPNNQSVLLDIPFSLPNSNQENWSYNPENFIFNNLVISTYPIYNVIEFKY